MATNSNATNDTNTTNDSSNTGSNTITGNTHHINKLEGIVIDTVINSSFTNSIHANTASITIRSTFDREGVANSNLNTNATTGTTKTHVTTSSGH
eukprot:5946083-Pyramimonas_sp.AAC.1